MTSLQQAAEMLGILLLSDATVYGAGDPETWTICGHPYREVRAELLRELTDRVSPPGKRTPAQRFPESTNMRDPEPTYFTPFGILTAKEIEELEQWPWK